MSVIENFATTHPLSVKRQHDGEGLIVGRRGYIFEDGERLGIALLDTLPSQRSKARTLLSLRKKAIAAGFVARQLGDAESVFEFDPNKPGQAKEAIALVGVRRRRRLSQVHRLKLLEASKPTQYKPEPTVLQAELETQEREKTPG